MLPQLYFYIGYPIADYAVLSDWWSKYNYGGANVYAGLAPYRVSKKAKDKQWHNSKELIKQINRNFSDPNIKGEIYFSAKSVFNKPDVNLQKQLTRKEYKSLSLSPENNRIKRIEPQNPVEPVIEIVDDKNIKLKWQRGGKDAKRFVIYKFKRNKPVNIDNPENIVEVTGLTEISLPVKKKDLKKYRYGITSLSPSHSESSIVYFD